MYPYPLLPRIDAQAQAVLANLQQSLDCYLEHPRKLFEDPNLDTEVVHFRNGRERGYCIKILNYSRGEGLMVFFGEHRNSDSLFVQFEIKATKDMGLNSPVIEDFTDEGYNQRKFFSSFDIHNACKQIGEYIEKFIDDA